MMVSNVCAQAAAEAEITPRRLYHPQYAVLSHELEIQQEERNTVTMAAICLLRTILDVLREEMLKDDVEAEAIVSAPASRNIDAQARSRRLLCCSCWRISECMVKNDPTHTSRS